ncbi:hypothetical protein ACKF11_01465 [Methylobacillus sp. Pita2]|uniref:hypothetical protein n=1 Tax=Methylobacillus sp. Pita2 TaxID=3383245 RepID=UPI0038B496D3
MTLVELAKFFWLHDLIRIKSNATEGLQNWFLTGDYLISQVPTNKKIEVFPRSTEELTKAFSNDLSRLSSAAFESAEGLTKNPIFPYSSGWILVRAYYSAYFAANALMRCFGYSSTNIDILQITSLKDTARLCGFPCPSKAKTTPQPGVYFIEYSVASLEVTLSIVNSNGGVHGKFWESFSKFISSLELKISNSTSLVKDDKKKAKKELDTIKKMLCGVGSTNFNWLSFVRNNINYRLDYDVWHPYKDCEMDSEQIIKIFDDIWKQTPDPSLVNVNTDNLQKFIAVCAFMVSWCKATLEKMSNFNTPAAHFLKKGPISFLTTAGI